jgi:fibronectin-binding autotransporter adhesin
LTGGDASGLWSDSSAWAGGVIGNGAGFTANFATLDLSVPSTVQLDTPRTIGNLVFGDTDPTTPANWALGNNFDPLNVLTLSGGTPTITANGGAGSTVTINTILAGSEGLTILGNSTLLAPGNIGHTYTGGTLLKGRVETTNLANAPLTIFGAAVADNTLTFDAGYFKIFNTTTSTSAGTLVNNLVVNTTGTLEYSGRSATTGTLTGGGVFDVITHYVRSDNGGNWSAFSGTINVNSGDAGIADFRQTTYSGFAGAMLNLNANANFYFTPNQTNTTNPLTGTGVDIGALSGVASAVLRGGPVAGRVTSFRIGGKNIDTTFAGAIEVDTASNRLSNVVKNGTGTLTLSSPGSAYTGPTFINAGTLAVTTLANGGSVSSIGRSAGTASNLVIDGGTLRYAGAGNDTDRLFTVGVNGATIDASGAGAVNFTNPGPIDLAGLDIPHAVTLTGASAAENTLAALIADNGAGATTLTKSGAGTWNVTGANTFTGPATINGGVLAVKVLANGGAPSGIGQSSNAAANLVIDGGTLRYTGAGATSDRAITIGAGGATIDASGTGALVLSNSPGFVLSGTDLPRTLTLAGTSPGDNILAPTITNAGTGVTSLVKAGSGTWILPNANTYTGGTVINGGTLKAGNTSGSATGPGPVTVNANGALGGGGSVTGAVTINPGGKIIPGAGVGAMSVGNLTLMPGAILDFEFNSSPANDLISVTVPNGFTINGGGFNLFTQGTTNRWATPGTYQLVQYSGTLAGSGPGALSVLNPQNGLNYTFGSSNGFLTLVITATSRLSNWTATTGGSWNTAANWSNGIPNAQNDSANFPGSLGAPGVVTLDGTKTVGTLQFNNANSYTIAPGSGGTLVLDSGAGTAQITVLQGSHAMNTPMTLASQTVVDVNNSADTFTISGSVGGNGALTKSGQGTLALSGTNNFGNGNGTTLQAGVIQIGSNNALGNGPLSVTGPATLRAGAPGLAPANSVSISNAVTAVIDTLSNALDLRGTISNNASGSGAVRKIGSGTLTLGDANTYTGATTIGEGVLSVGTVADGGTASSIGQSSNAASNLVIDGGTLRYIGAGANTDRLFTVGASGATIDASGSGALNFTNPGALALGGSGLARTLTLTGTQTTANTLAAIIADNGSGATALAKTGPGTWLLGGPNTFTGQTVVSGGTLALGHSLALQNSTLNYNNQGGTLSFDALSAATLGGLTGTQGLALDNAFVTPVALTVGASNASTTYNGVLSGGGSLIKIGAGTFELGNKNTYVGTTTIATGGGALKLLVTDALAPGTLVNVNNPGGLQLGNGIALATNVVAAVGANEFIDVPDAGATATFAGTMSVAGGGNQFRLGISGAGATLNVTGAVNIANAASITFLTRGNLTFAGDATLTAAPGITIGRSAESINVTFKDNASATIGGASGFGGNQANPAMTLTLQDNAALNFGSNGLDLNASSAAVSQTAINLNGGTLTAGAFFKTSIGDTQTAVINWNGGLLRAGATGPAFLPALPGVAINVQTGGAKIDTSNFEVTVAQPIAHDERLDGRDGGLRKVGEGVLTLAADNTYDGPTLVDLGKVVLSGTLNATSRVVVQGATLELGAADRVNDAANFELNGNGLFDTRGFNEMAGALTLSGDGRIELGNGASIVHFADSSAAAWSPGTLTIAGWTGAMSGSGVDQLYFGNSAAGLTAAQLAQIHFLDPSGFAPGVYPAQILGTGELVAIPEPRTFVLSLFAFSIALLGRLRRPRGDLACDAARSSRRPASAKKRGVSTRASLRLTSSLN